MRTLALLLALAAPTAAADVISVSKMQVGDTGVLSVPPGGFIVDEVGDDWIAVRFRHPLDDTRSVILIRGIPTAGLVDDRRWEPPREARFKVEKTEKHGGKTVFSLRPVKEKK